MLIWVKWLEQCQLYIKHQHMLGGVICCPESGKYLVTQLHFVASKSWIASETEEHKKSVLLEKQLEHHGKSVAPSQIHTQLLKTRNTGHSFLLNRNLTASVEFEAVTNSQLKLAFEEIKTLAILCLVSSACYSWEYCCLAGLGTCPLPSWLLIPGQNLVLSSYSWVPSRLLVTFEM